MAEDIKRVIQIETDASVRTVKSLKQEISDLRDALLNVERGSEEYDNITKKLNKDIDDLNDVMGKNKKTVTALEGSYDALVQQMAELKKQWRATNDEMERNSLGVKIDEINTQLKDMDASIGNYQRNVGNYADSFSDAMSRQQKATEKTRAKFESISKTAAGLAGAYSAIQGATALLGVENENLEKTFVKLQGGIALAQGVGGLKDLVEGLGLSKVAFADNIKAVKGFITGLSGVKKALLATGIGALIVALGVLIANWDKVTEALGFNTAAQKKQEEAAKKAAEEQEKSLNRIGNAASKPLAQFRQLERQYKNLKTQSEKTQWIKDNASAFDELGLSVKGIVDAENIFINNTDDYVNAIITRAMATAKEEELAELAAKAAKQKASADEKYSKYKKYNTSNENDISYRVGHNDKDGFEYKDENGQWRLTKKGARMMNDAYRNNVYYEYNTTVNEMKKVADEIATISESVSAHLVTTTKKTANSTNSTAEDATKKAKEIAENARKSLIDSKDEELAEIKRVYDEEKALLEKQGIDTTALTEKYEKDKSAVVKKYADAELKLAQETDKKLRDILNKSLKESSQKLSDAERNIELKYTESESTPNLLKAISMDDYLSPIQKQIDKENELRKVREDAYLEQIAQMDKLLNDETLSAEEKAKLREEYTALVSEQNFAEQESDKRLAEYQKRLAEEKVAMQRMTNQAILDTTSSLLGSMASLYDEESKEYKAIASMQAIIDALSAANAAYKAMAGITTVGPALGAAAAAAALIAGYANVKKINETTKDSQSTTIPSVSSVSTPVSYTRNYTNSTDSEVEMNTGSNSTRVYVVESDITETQSKVAMVESSATF